MLSKNIDMEQMFNKKYTLKFNCNNLTPPVADSLFNSEPWQDQRFQDLKNSLNLQKSRLNDYELSEWQNHTFNTNPAKDVIKALRTNIKPELLTVAWMKFYECASNYDIIPDCVESNKVFNSIHLCEAPGAFIASLNHFLKTNFNHLEWNWLATTLNPYYEENSPTSTICDDRFIKHTLNNWSFGSDYTGNLMDWDNSTSIVKKAKEIGQIHLITADGSIDCSLKPEDQESTVASLHYCEVITALQILDEGGTFILKIFTAFEHHTINLIYLLASCFESINFFKPVTSKPGNSEVYLICLKYIGFFKIENLIYKFKNYYGIDDFNLFTMIPYDALPGGFVEDVLYCCYSYYYYQYCTIDENICIFENIHSQTQMLNKLKKIQKKILKKYLKIYNFKPIDDSQKVIIKYNYKEHKILARNHYQIGTYSERLNSDKFEIEEILLRAKQEIENYNNTFTSTPVIINCNKLQKPKLSFTYGKPITAINSTYFSEPFVFKMYTKLKSLIKINENSRKLPKVLKNLNSCTINFEYFNSEDCYESWEKHLLILFLTTISKMNNGENLSVFNCDLMLTQFGAGLLYVISTIGFKKIDFQENIICLHYLRNKSELLSFLTNIKHEIKYENIVSSKKAVLGVVPIELLFFDDFFWGIVTHNSLSLYNYILKCVNSQ